MEKFLNCRSHSDDSEENLVDRKISGLWKQVWKTESYENVFQGLLEPCNSINEGKKKGYIGKIKENFPLSRVVKSLEIRDKITLNLEKSRDLETN